MAFKVFSHQRSGTHLLLETLDLNFKDAVNRWGSKSHTPWKGGFNGQSIYLVRDCRDVLVSCYYYWKKGGSPRTEIHGTMKWHPITFSEFIRGKLKLDYLPEGWIDYAQDPINFWIKHVEWADKMCTVKYEDLVTDPEKVMTEISYYFGVPLNDPPLVKLPKKVEKLVGIYPRKGIAGDWKNHFSDEDLLYFWIKIGTAMEKFGYPAVFKDLEQLHKVLEKVLCEVEI